MQVLEINNLSKNYGKIKALDGLSLKINAGEIYGILGPNGSGKTTTLGIILGILAQSQGDYTWFEGKYGEKSRMRIGSILETPNFYPYLNAEKNLQIISAIKKVNDDSYEKSLKLVDLYHRKDSAFKTYSLGMKQRLAIAATLIGDPDVVIFDEPTNGLDPQGIAEVRNILKRVADTGKTVIMASHILDEVEKICSHVAIIKNGVLLDQGKVGSLLGADIVAELMAEDEAKLKSFLAGQSFIKSTTNIGNVIECVLTTDMTAAKLNKVLSDHGIYLTHLVVRARRLEEEFLAITNQAKQN